MASSIILLVTLNDNALFTVAISKCVLLEIFSKLNLEYFDGISILIYELTHYNIAIPLIIFNLPFVYLGLKKIGKKFAVLSLFAIVLLSLALQFVNIPTITEDKILIAIFGGLFIGLANGFVIKAGAALDGLEIIALYTNKTSRFKTHEIQMFIATIVFVILGKQEYTSFL